MNIFDFDGTIRKGDSSVSFYLFCLFRRPYLVFLLPVQGIAALLWAVKAIDITAFKQAFYIYFRFINAEKLTVPFWKRREQRFIPGTAASILKMISSSQPHRNFFLFRYAKTLE